MTTMSADLHGGVSVKSYETFLLEALRDPELAAAYPTIVTLRSVVHALGLDLAFTPAASTT